MVKMWGTVCVSTLDRRGKVTSTHSTVSAQPRGRETRESKLHRQRLHAGKMREMSYRKPSKVWRHFNVTQCKVKISYGAGSTNILHRHT